MPVSQPFARSAAEIERIDRKAMVATTHRATFLATSSQLISFAFVAPKHPQEMFRRPRKRLMAIDRPKARNNPIAPAQLQRSESPSDMVESKRANPVKLSASTNNRA